EGDGTKVGRLKSLAGRETVSRPGHGAGWGKKQSADYPRDKADTKHWHVPWCGMPVFMRIGYKTLTKATKPNRQHHGGLLSRFLTPSYRWGRTQLPSGHQVAVFMGAL